MVLTRTIMMGHSDVQNSGITVPQGRACAHNDVLGGLHDNVPGKIKRRDARRYRGRSVCWGLREVDPHRWVKVHGLCSRCRTPVGPSVRGDRLPKLGVRSVSGTVLGPDTTRVETTWAMSSAARLVAICLPLSSCKGDALCTRKGPDSPHCEVPACLPCRPNRTQREKHELESASDFLNARLRARRWTSTALSVILGAPETEGEASFRRIL